jgi:hypothetical protein
MTLCLAFGDNPPPASNSHRRSSEQTALANTCPSVSPPTERLYTSRHRPRPWNSGTFPSAFGYLERRGASTPSPAATEQSRAPKGHATRWTSALDHRARAPHRDGSKSVTAADRTTNPRCRCRHRRGAAPPPSRQSHLRDQCPGPLGVPTESAGEPADPTEDAILARGSPPDDLRLVSYRSDTSDNPRVSPWSSRCFGDDRRRPCCGAGMLALGSRLATVAPVSPRERADPAEKSPCWR